ncbi:hypothetical protein Tco_0551903 [Tanacetum coccineum]
MDTFALRGFARRRIKISEPVDIGDHDQESIATSVEVKCVKCAATSQGHGSNRVAVEVVGGESYNCGYINLLGASSDACNYV